MTRTVLIEGLIDVIKGIANKIEANPSGSHLTTDIVGERGEGLDLVAVLNNAAKKTPLTSCAVDYTYKVDGSPSVADPSIINLIGNQLGLVMLDADEVEEHKMYQIDLGHPSQLDTAEDPAAGHIDVTNGVVTVTHVRRILSPTYEDWEKDGVNDGSFYCEIDKIKPDSEFVCNMGEWVAPASYAADKVTTDNQTVELWLAPSGTSLDDWKDFLRNNRVEIVYELNEPITYTINPTEIKTLNCYNNVLIAYQEYVTALNVTYVRDESKAIEVLEQQGGGGFAPTPLTLTLPAQQSTGTDIPVEEDMSEFDWIMVEVTKPNEMMSGYSGSFNGIIWIPTDRMGNGETGTTETELGASFNFTNPTSGAVTVQGMLSIKDAHNLHWVFASSLVVHRAWGI